MDHVAFSHQDDSSSSSNSSYNGRAWGFSETVVKHWNSSSSNILMQQIGMALSVFILSLKWWNSSRSGSVCRTPNKRGVLRTADDDDVRIRRKNEFVKRAGSAYGYNDSPMGHIDTWRRRELPALISPLGVRNDDDEHKGDDDDDRSPDAPMREAVVYLDYAGSALTWRSQLQAALEERLLLPCTNPHSTGPLAGRTAARIHQVQSRILTWLDGHPGSHYGMMISTTASERTASDHPSCRHPGYEVVFTANATDAMRRVAEHFDWGTEHTSTASHLIYPQAVHTSVLGMRQVALQRGAKFHCVPGGSNTTFLDSIVEQIGNSSNSKSKHLVVLPMECNFGGDKPDWTTTLCPSEKLPPNCYTLLDLSKFATTHPVSLTDLDPDFACLSLYKVMGVPTGLGCLLIKRTRLDAFQSSNNSSIPRRHYFGGGSVDVVAAGSDFVVPRSEPSPTAGWNHGTPHFDGICNVLHGLDTIKRLGGMVAIQKHTEALAEEFVRRLLELRHGNGGNVVEIYGDWSKYQGRHSWNSVKTSTSKPGPTVAFNVKRRNGDFVGYNQVGKLAEANRPPIQFRTGCFCNPGACQIALGLSDDDVQRNYKKSGKICGDQNDIIDGRPTGAIRVSFGKDSIWEDLDVMVTFLEKLFVAKGTPAQNRATVANAGPVSTTISEIFVFPIKSCAAMSVKQWSFDTNFKPLWDREFVLVDSAGSAMRLQQYPRMAYLQPTVDLQNRTMTLSAPGKASLSLELDAETSYDEKHVTNTVRVCGSKCSAHRWGSGKISAWLSDFMGVPCWLARHIKTPSRTWAFANEQPTLLISANAVDRLNSVLNHQGQTTVSSRHFRPNLVVKAAAEVSTSNYIEDNWNSIRTTTGTSFKVTGRCARCSMVDLDPTSGKRSSRTLRALAEFKRESGKSQMTFGIFLTGSGVGHRCHQLRVGDVLYCT